jgi:predicted O-methyltransferase YrrM
VRRVLFSGLTLFELCHNRHMPNGQRFSRYISAWLNFGQIRDLRYDTPESLLDAVNSFAGGFFTAIQVPSEIYGAMREIHGARPKYVVEVGTSGAGTLLIWTRIVDPEATIVSVDLPGFPAGPGYSLLRTPLLKRCPLPGQNLQLVRANSQAPSTVEKVKRHLDGHQVDFLFIDADHSEAGVRADYALYSPLVRDGGLIMFHDIAVTGRSTYGVHKLWRELAATHEHQEFIGSPVAYGIGILRVRRPETARSTAAGF